MQAYDIYNVIHSPQIRDYFRRAWKMTMEEKLCLVARSYADTREKIDILHLLVNESAGTDNALANEMARYLEIGHESILHPAKASLYIVRIVRSTEPDVENNQRLADRLDTEYGMTEYLTSFEDVIGYLEVERGGEERIYWEAEVEQICFPFHKEKHEGWYGHSPDWTFWLAYIDGNWVIRAFEGLGDVCDNGEAWYVNHGISEEIYDMATFADAHALGHRFSLPFERGDKVKLQTPLMKKPLIGIFDPYCVGQDHHFYICAEDSFPAIQDGGKKDFLIVSYQLLSPSASHTFCLWDWLERA